MLAQLVEDLIHLERRGGDRDEHGRLDRPARDAEHVLRVVEAVVPQARLEVALRLRQVEIRSAALVEQASCVVEEVQAEVHERAHDGPAVDGEVFLDEVPAARAHDERRDLVVQAVRLALGAREVDRPLDRVDEVGVARDHVLPGRRVRVLEVGHEHGRAGVERVDDHLAVRRSGDLDLADLEILRDGRDLPVGGADVRGLGQEVEGATALEDRPPLLARAEERVAPRSELTLQRLDERERVAREDAFGVAHTRTADLESADGHGASASYRRRVARDLPFCMAQDARDMGGALLGETTFAAIGVVFLLSSIRTFTSSLYMSLYGNVPNETVGGIVLGVFAASILAALVGWRLRHRRAIALSGTLLAGGTVLATVVRWSWGDIVLSAVAVVGGTWWLTLAHSARPQGRTSPFVLGLPIAIAADLALRAGFRTVPVVDLAQPLSIALVALGALVFVAAGLASYEADRQWTSPGLRGALALIAIPPLILVGELAATNPIVAAVAGDAAKGPEGAGRWYRVAAAMGLAMTSGASSADRRLPAPRLFAIAALVLGAVLFWSRVPLAGTVGAVVMAMGLVIAATVLPDTAARPSGSPVVTAVALAIGWIVFVALAFLFYAYYALPAAAWIAVALVAVGVIAAVSLPGRRVGPVGIALIALLTVVVPVASLVTTPAAGEARSRSTFRLMTYNVH